MLEILYTGLCIVASLQQEILPFIDALFMCSFWRTLTVSKNMNYQIFFCFFKFTS